MLSVETNETKKGLGIHARRALAYIVLVIMSFCRIHRIIQMKCLSKQVQV